MRSSEGLNPKCAAGAAARGLALAGVLVLPLAGLVAERLEVLADPGQRPLTDRAAALTAACLLLLPPALDKRLRPLCAVPLAAAAGGLTALALPVVLGRADLGIAVATAGALVVAVMTLLIGATSRLLLEFIGDPTAAMGWVLLTALVLAATPLWLAEPLDRGAPIADLLVIVNPLTGLGLCGAVDYPRDAWLYRHSPLGGVRYQYPSLASLLLCYLLAGLGALTLADRADTQARRAAVRVDQASANPVETLP